MARHSHMLYRGGAGHLPGVRALTQAHSLGPRVVGGSIGLRRARRTRPQRPGEAEPVLRGRARRSPPSEVGRGGASPQRSGEAELAHLGVGWSCSRTLDCSDESMLMVISSSSSGTLVLVPDSSLRAYEGVEYSFGGFSKQEDSEGLGLLLSPTA